jgi:hypothetical protein
MDLVKMLTSQLGVSDKQATGGAGLILQLAKSKLGGADFGKVASAIPDVEKLLSAAPKSGGIAGAIGGLTSSLGGGAGQLGNIAALAGGFKKLDLDPGLISKFVPIILQFVQSKGGSNVKGILEKVLK